MPILKPLTDTISDLDALRSAMARLVVDWDWSQFPIKDVLVDGETVMVHFMGRMRHVPSGVDLQTETIDKLAPRDGKSTASSRSTMSTAMTSVTSSFARLPAD